MTLRRLVHASIGHPCATLLAWSAAVCAASFWLAGLRFETTARGFLDRAAPAWQRYIESCETFGSDELIVVAFEAERPFGPRGLARARDLTERTARIAGVRRVDSLSSVPIVRARADGDLSLDPAVRAGALSGEEALRVEEALRGDRISPNLLVSSDGRTPAVNVWIEAEGGADRARILHEIEALTADAPAWISGVPVFETRVSERTRQELLAFVPLAALLLVATLWLSMRAVMSVVIPLLASGVPCVLVLGLMGAVGIPFTMLSMLLPSVLLALGCAYVMHLLVACRGVREPAQLERAVLSVARPTALSGITTSLGFLAVCAAPIEAIRQMGLLGATGVLLTLASSLTLAPALLRLAPRPERRGAWDPWIEREFAPRLMRLMWKRRRGVIACWTLILSLFGLCLIPLEIETDAVHWFPEHTRIRRDYEEIRTRLSGISPINVMLEATAPDGSTVSPGALERIDALARHLESRPEVGRAVSVADPLRQLHGGFSDDASQPLPRDGPLIAQYLLLLDSVEQLDDVVSSDRRRASVMLRMDHNGSRHLLEVARDAEAWWQEHGTPELRASSTGIMFEFARSQEAITRGQLLGLLFALSAIGIILISVVRSPRTALIALVPNAIPLVLVFGLLGLLGVPLDAGVVCLGSLALGIAVDDTTHIVLRYQDALQQGQAPERALDHAFQSVLPAVVLSTIAVSLGFAVLGLSEFTLTRNVGLVTVAIVTACLVADTTLLPALLAPPRDLTRSGALSPRTRRDPYLPPLYDYEAPSGDEWVEKPGAGARDPYESDAAWLESAVAMNPGFELARASRAEHIALAMLDPACTYSLAVDYSLLRDRAGHGLESVPRIHRLLWPLALAESLRVMIKLLLYRLWHVAWYASRSREERARFLLGPRRVMSCIADGSSPLLYALRHGVTTSAALDVLYNSTAAGLPGRGLRRGLAWFWLHEPHACGVRNRMRMVYTAMRQAMRERHRPGEPLRILSLACGSAQPVIEAVADFMQETPGARVSLELVDLDVPSLRRAERFAFARGIQSSIRLRRQNVRTFLELDARRWPIVEMVGFLDYRDNASLRTTCARIHERLEPDGFFVTATVCPSAWASVVRWLANWPFLVRRSPRAFRNLLESAGFRSPRDHYVSDPTGTFLLGHLYRDHEDAGATSPGSQGRELACAPAGPLDARPRSR